MTRTYLGLLEQKIAEYASDDDDWDDISHIDRQQLLPEYSAFFAELLERGNWSSSKASNGRTVYYHTVEMYPTDQGSVGSKLVAMVAPDRRGRACVTIKFRPYYDKDQYSRRATETRTFTPETIQSAMAYIETLEAKCRTGFQEVADALSDRRFWKFDTYEPNLHYCTIDLYPESWGVDGSKLAARFSFDKRGRPILIVTYIKNPYSDRNRKKVDSRKVFDETNIQQAMPYIEQMEARCRQYHQFRD